jgi:transposase
VLEVLPQLLEEGRIDEVLAAFRVLVARNEELEKRLAKLVNRGHKSNEGVSTAQLRLLLEQCGQQQAKQAEDEDGQQPVEVDARLMAQADAAAERARTKALALGCPPKQKPTRKPFPEHLPRRENVIDVPEAERVCPSCGGTRDVCGHDVSEVLELEPAKLYVRRDKRLKRTCRPCDGPIVRAPRGDKVVVGGQFGCGFVASLLYQKYEQGLPLHRQRKDLARMGIKVSTSTLCDQVKWASELLTPLWLEAIDGVLAADVMHIDGSGVKVLDRDHRDGKRLGTLWATVGADADGPKLAAYHYASTKKAKGQRPGELGPTDILSLRRGIVVSDADTLFIEQMRREEVIDCGCNMHARRYFAKALDGGDKRAAPAIGAFKGLYQIEDELRDASPDARLDARRERSTPIYDDISAWCHHHERDTPPSSPLGRAIRYLIRHEDALRRFESDGRIPIDNAAAEHAFVPVALTRKNYLFFGADQGGDRAAIVYTILRCCRLAKIDPVEYMKDVLAILSRGIRRVDVPELLPARWKPSGSSA